ncbi:hypothetical protein ACHAXA_011036 [Cyclostephanos tholiformis]|uniref:Chitin-binding type-1 domain-containing protein n=1 Tax=Cyclostephanos tholiformis TaxID=382380 RepID=A0ABD3RYX4_9STRA
MKQSSFFFAVASLRHSVHAHERSLRSAKAETQCTDTIGWVDSEGDGCDWYEANDSPYCPYYGNSYDGGMGVADDNCCFCAGTGAPSPAMTPWPSTNFNFEWPTYSPTVTQAPTTSAAPSNCIGNTAGWVDSYGDGCDWYEAMDLPGCPNYGRLYNGTMGFPDDNCCYCAGTGAPSPPTPTYPPVPMPTYHPSTTDPACGYGHVGDGVCTGAKLCCSVFGWCGYGDDYCGINKFVPLPTPAASPTETLV